MTVSAWINSAAFPVDDAAIVSRAGWQGAVYGGLIGGAVEIVAPWLSAQAGALVAGGSATAEMLVTTGTYVAMGAPTGAGATAYINLVSGKDNLSEGVAYGTVLGALAPLMSAEAFVVGAGGELAFGTGVANSFSAATGVIGAFGAAMDPSAQHGFQRPNADKSLQCR